MHYEGRLASSFEAEKAAPPSSPFPASPAPLPEAFVDTRSEPPFLPVPIVSRRTLVARERCLSLAVSRLRPGGRALVWSAPEHAYGAEGSFSFPSVPGGEAVEFLLELVDWETPFGEDAGAGTQGGTARSDGGGPSGGAGGRGAPPASPAPPGQNPRAMLFEDRLEASERRRLEGNALLGEKKYQQALGRYLSAASFVDEDLLLQLMGRHEALAREARRAALCNASLAALRLGDARQAEQLATEALAATEEGKDAKAHARRAAARRELGDVEGAAADVDAALALAPNDAGLRAEKRELQRERKKQREAGAGVFKGIFG